MSGVAAGWGTTAPLTPAWWPPLSLALDTQATSSQHSELEIYLGSRRQAL